MRGLVCFCRNVCARQKDQKVAAARIIQDMQYLHLMASRRHPCSCVCYNIGHELLDYLGEGNTSITTRAQ